MNATTSKTVGRPGKVELPAGAWGRHLAVTGVAALGVALLVALTTQRGLEHLLHAYLLSLCFVISISLGALFFVILQHLTRAGWSVVVRRLAEVTAVPLTLMMILFVPLLGLLLAGDSRLYEWNDIDLRQSDDVIRGKAAYLNAPFFAIRTFGYGFTWSLLAHYFWRQSVKQDHTEDPSLTWNMQKWSGPAMMAFAVTVCFAAFDWLMSLDPHWFSTIYGVYFFSGAVVGFIAFSTLVLLALEHAGIVKGAVSAEHYHDLGKLLFGFVFFWAYIAFSQYLLIWYANIPEETIWYLARQSGDWRWVSLLLLLGHFVLPFGGLLSRGAKRRKLVLAGWSAWLLVMHWVDLYWLVMPHYSAVHLPWGFVDLLALVGIGCLYISSLIFVAKRNSLVPTADPRLRESLAFQNV